MVKRLERTTAKERARNNKIQEFQEMQEFQEHRNGTPRVVNLDKYETPTNSMYLRVVCFGMEWRPTRVERMLLKVYNTHTPQRATFDKYAGILRRRGFAGEWQQFQNYAVHIEGYARALSLIWNVTETCDGLIDTLQDVCNEDLTKAQLSTEVVERIKKQHMFRKSVLVAVHDHFEACNMPLFLYPLPFRVQLRGLNMELRLIETLTGHKFNRSENGLLPPFDWGDIDPNTRNAMRVVLINNTNIQKQTLFQNAEK